MWVDGVMSWQVMWLTNEMIRVEVREAERLVYAFLKQIKGGDTTADNIWLVESVLHLLLDFKWGGHVHTHRHMHTHSTHTNTRTHAHTQHVNEDYSQPVFVSLCMPYIKLCFSFSPSPLHYSEHN